MTDADFANFLRPGDASDAERCAQATLEFIARAGISGDRAFPGG